MCSIAGSGGILRSNFADVVQPAVIVSTEESGSVVCGQSDILSSEFVSQSLVFSGSDLFIVRCIAC